VAGAAGGLPALVGGVRVLRARWSARELPRRLADRLRGRIRIACGRSELPTAAVIDAQTVRGTDTVPAVSAGYDAGNYGGRVVMPDWLVATVCSLLHSGEASELAGITA
jgi:hypothetical protein